MSGPYLKHVTLLTGHSRRSPRSEVADEVIERLAPVLSEALTGGEYVEILSSGWFP